MYPRRCRVGGKSQEQNCVNDRQRRLLARPIASRRARSSDCWASVSSRNRSSVDKPSSCSVRRASSSSRAASSDFTTCSCSSRSRSSADRRESASSSSASASASRRASSRVRARLLFVLAQDAPEFRILGLRHVRGPPADRSALPGAVRLPLAAVSCSAAASSS